MRIENRSSLSLPICVRVVRGGAVDAPSDSGNVPIFQTTLSIHATWTRRAIPEVLCTQRRPHASAGCKYLAHTSSRIAIPPLHRGGCTVALRRDEEPRQEYGDLGKPKLDQSGRQQDHTARSLQGKWHRSWRRGSCEDVDRSQQQCHFATHAEWRDAHARNLRGGRFCCRDDWQRRCCDRWRRRWLELGRRRWHRLGRRRCFCWWRWFWLC